MPTHSAGPSTRWIRERALVLGSAALLFALAVALSNGCASAPSAGSVTLVLAGYTAPREVYSKAIIPAFKTYWKQKTGQDVDFQESYQGSGAQARAIAGGFEAD